MSIVSVIVMIILSVMIFCIMVATFEEIVYQIKHYRAIKKIRKADKPKGLHPGEFKVLEMPDRWYKGKICKADLIVTLDKDPFVGYRYELCLVHDKDNFGSFKWKQSNVNKLTDGNLSEYIRKYVYSWNTLVV